MLADAAELDLLLIGEALCEANPVPQLSCIEAGAPGMDEIDGVRSGVLGDLGREGCLGEVRAHLREGHVGPAISHHLIDACLHVATVDRVKLIELLDFPRIGLGAGVCQSGLHRRGHYLYAKR